MKNYFRWLCIILSFAFFLTACRNQSEKATGPPEKLTVAYSTSFSAILVFLAFAKGFFTQEGLDAEPQPHAFGKLALKSVLDGKADLATVADTPIMFAVLGGQKVSILAVIQSSAKNSGIIARRGSGISKPSDLKGKKIGVSLGTTADFFTEAFLLVNGIHKTHVTIIDLKPEEMAAALATGKVDAVSIWNPFLSNLQKELKNSGITFYVDAVYTETFCIAAKQDFVKQHPEAAKKFMRALIRAETFAIDYPEETRKLVAEFLKGDKALLDAVWDIFTLRVTLDQALIAGIENQTRWAMRNQLTTQREMPNYLDSIDATSLLAVKPEAVRIIR